jgi:hypothetical protein
MGGGWSLQLLREGGNNSDSPISCHTVADFHILMLEGWRNCGGFQLTTGGEVMEEHIHGVNGVFKFLDESMAEFLVRR